MFKNLNIPFFIREVKQTLFVLLADNIFLPSDSDRSRYFCGFIGRFVVSSCMFLFIVQAINGQSLQPAKGSNHYILLIDASGSTTQTAGKRKNFEKALLERLISGLYKDGFGSEEADGRFIPPYDPKQDWLTLHKFGIVTGDSGTAYKRLGDYDFLTQFIHPVFVRKKEIYPDYLKENLIPTQTYNLTVLSWSKQLALENSRPPQPDDTGNRTFLISVHDAEPNENSLAEEVNLVRQWNGDGYEKALSVINSINNNYRFTDGQSNNQPVWSDKITGETNGTSAPVFIDAYEVVSVNQAQWESDGKKLKPLDSLKFEWIKESGNNPEGQLTAVLNKGFETWLNSAESAETGLAIEKDGNTVVGQGLKVPVSFNEPLPCGSRKLEAFLNIKIQTTDKILGRKVISYTYPATVLTPSPLVCTAGFYISGATILIISALMSTAFFYYFYYRFRFTHLEIEIPGAPVPIQVKRQGQRSIDVPIVPRADMEALTLKLPGLFKQYLFYRGGKLTIVSDKGEIQWSVISNRSLIKLPLAYEYVLANWTKLSDESSSVALIYQQGKQNSKILFSYPRAVAAPYKEKNL